MNTRLLGALVMTTFALMAAGCGGGSGGGGDPGAAPAPAPAPAQQGNLDGQVINANTGAAIAGATIRSGAITATTDANGRYSLQVNAGTRLPLMVTADGFAESLTIANGTDSGTLSPVTRLLPLGTTATINNATGGTVTVPGSTAQVVLPANAFGPAVTNVRVELTAVDPALDPTQMPGDFTTADGQRIESAGAVIVTPRDAANGNVLQLAAGQSATIRIPLSTRGTVTPTIPLFFLNTETGRWVQEGTATLAGTAPNQYYEGTVTHFSTWNADRLYDSITVSGCVQNASGARVSGVTITSDGIDYSGLAYGRTNTDGNFTVQMKKSARAAISGREGRGLQTNTVSVGPSATDITLSACLVIADAANAIRVKLTWGQVPRDVDSWLFTPNGSSISYINQGSLTSEPYANLDVDDTTSFGPEVVTINRLMVGTYRYGVHNYSGENNPNMTNSPVRVELELGGRLQVFTLPAGEGTNRFVRLFDLTVDERCNTTVTTVNSWEADVPQTPAGSTARFCTP